MGSLALRCCSPPPPALPSPILCTTPSGASQVPHLFAPRSLASRPFASWSFASRPSASPTGMRHRNRREISCPARLHPHICILIVLLSPRPLRFVLLACSSAMRRPSSSGCTSTSGGACTEYSHRLFFGASSLPTEPTRQSITCGDPMAFPCPLRHKYSHGPFFDAPTFALRARPITGTHLHDE